MITYLLKIDIEGLIKLIISAGKLETTKFLGLVNFSSFLILIAMIVVPRFFGVFSRILDWIVFYILIRSEKVKNNIQLPEAFSSNGKSKGKEMLLAFVLLIACVFLLNLKYPISSM